MRRRFLADAWPPTSPVYDLSRDPRYFGLLDPAIGPVASGGAARPKALFVGGRAIVRDGALPGLDLKALGREAKAVVARLAGA